MVNSNKKTPSSGAKYQYPQKAGYDIDNIASYTVLYNSTNALYRKLIDLSVVEKVCLIGKKAKGHTYKKFKTMQEHINLTFHNQVIVEHVTIKVAELKRVLF